VLPLPIVPLTAIAALSTVAASTTVAAAATAFGRFTSPFRPLGRTDHARLGGFDRGHRGVGPGLLRPPGACLARLAVTPFAGRTRLAWRALLALSLAFARRSCFARLLTIARLLTFA